MRRNRFFALSFVLAVVGCAAVAPGPGGDDDGKTDDPSGMTADAAPYVPPVDAPPYVPPADASDITPVTGCQLAPQSGCPSGRACDIPPSGGTACRVVSTPGRDGATCATIDQCDVGYTCAGNMCYAYCATDAQCQAPGGRCVYTLNGPDGVTVLANMCSINCDPINSAGCPTGLACGLYALDETGATLLTDCQVAGTGMQGTPCTDSTTCAAGFSCVNVTATASQCLRTCLVSPPGSPCPGGTTCQGYQPPSVLGGAEYGSCI